MSAVNYTKEEQFLDVYTNSHEALQVVDSWSAGIIAPHNGYDLAMHHLDMFADKVCQYKRVTIPAFGGVVFASDMLHAGVENQYDFCTMRVFCQLQGNVSLSYKLVDSISKLYHPHQSAPVRDDFKQDNIAMTVSNDSKHFNRISWFFYELFSQLGQKVQALRKPESTKKE